MLPKQHIKKVLLIGLIAVSLVLCFSGAVSATEHTSYFKSTDGTTEELISSEAHEDGSEFVLPSLPENTADRIYSKYWFYNGSPVVKTTDTQIITDMTYYARYYDPAKPFVLIHNSTYTPYASFDDAWNNAVEGDTVEVHADVTFTSEFELNKRVNLTDGSYYHDTKPVITVTDYGISVTAGDSSNNLTVEGFDFRLGDSVTLSNSCYVNFNRCDFMYSNNYQDSTPCIKDKSGTISMNNCTSNGYPVFLEDTADDTDATFDNFILCDITVSDMAFKPDGGRSMVYFNGCNITSSGSIVTASKKCYVTFGYYYDSATSEFIYTYLTTTGEQPVFKCMDKGGIADNIYIYGSHPVVTASANIFEFDEGSLANAMIQGGGEWTTDKKFAQLDSGGISIIDYPTITVTGDYPVIESNGNEQVGFSMMYPTISAPECTGYAVIIPNSGYISLYEIKMDVPKGSGFNITTGVDSTFALSGSGFSYPVTSGDHLATKGNCVDIHVKEGSGSANLAVTGIGVLSTDGTCIHITKDDAVQDSDVTLDLCFNCGYISESEDKSRTIDVFRENFINEGWYSDIDSKYIADGYLKWIDENYTPFTIYAVKQKGKITYHYPDETTTSYDAPIEFSFSLIPAEYKEEGKIFKGWDTSNPADEVIYKDCETYYLSSWWATPQYQDDLYAYVEDGYRTVTYLIDGEQYGDIDQESVNFEITVRDTGVVEGYTVSEWETDDVEVSEGKFVMPDKDITFEARKTINYYHSMYYLDGSLIEDELHKYGDEVNLRAKPTVTGYTVSEWETEDVTVTGGKYVMPAKNIRFDSYTDSQGYNVVYRVNSKEYGRESHNYGDSVEVKAKPDIEGYEFTEWDSDQITITDNRFTMPYNNVTMSSVKTLKSYPVTYETNGGVIVGEYPVTYTYGTGAVLPSDVTKDGYSFVGWYNNPELEGDAVEIIAYYETGDKTFYAKWQENSQPVVRSSGSSVTSFNGEITGNTVTFPRAMVVTSAEIPQVKQARYTVGNGDWFRFNLNTDVDSYTGIVYFKIPADVLSIKDKTTSNVVLQKGGENLNTVYLGSDGAYETYKAALTGDGTYLITFVDEDVAVSEDVLPSVVSEIKQEIEQVVVEKEPVTPAISTIAEEHVSTTKKAAKSPFPIVGVLAGLGLAGYLLLRRNH